MSRPLSRSFSPALPSPRRNDSRRGSRALSIGSRSRNSSRGRRDSITENHFRRSISVDRVQSYSAALAQAGGASRLTKARRWDGNDRTTSNWDSIRKDGELWFPTGDTLVHFYARGQSRRGPSLRLFLSDIKSSNCQPLLKTACSRAAPSPSNVSPHEESSDDGGYFTNPNLSGKYELYIPAPSHLSRDDALKYHLTTRNFFAWMFEKPLVGARLGETLIDLLERMNEWRPDQEENEDDFLAYIDSQGYTDFRDCPDHALAVLHFAEKYQYADLWTDAFVHCVGMNESLFSSSEFCNVSRTTNALITRANLEMDLRLEKASVSLATFLEDDLEEPYLGLNDQALKHLERFRSFLTSFYVQRHGYWPPHIVRPTYGKALPLPKHTLLTMYTDFRNLYEYLVDEFSTPEMAYGSDALYGGVSTLALVSSFDRRMKISSLPHPIPRLPAASFKESHASFQKTSFGASAWSRITGNKRQKQARYTDQITALTNATNIRDAKVANAAIVREYARFEREYTLRERDRFSSAEARKVRWILIYATLQTLISVTRAPEEVRDTQGVEYPLCCQTAGTPPWKYIRPNGSTSTESASASFATTYANTSLSRSFTATPVTEPSTPSVPPLDLDRVASKRQSLTSAPAPPPTRPAPISQPTTFESLVNDIQRSTASVRSSTATIKPPSLPPSNLQQPIKPKTLARTPPPPIRSPSLARSLTTRTTPVWCPQPRKPRADTVLLSSQAEDAAHEADAEADVESLSSSGDSMSLPTLASSVGESEPLTPTSPVTNTGGIGPVPPSPSIYDEDPMNEDASMGAGFRFESDESFKSGVSIFGTAMKSSVSLGSVGRHKRDRSSELARKWREEIRWREGPGWNGEVDAILRGEQVGDQ